MLMSNINQSTELKRRSEQLQLSSNVTNSGPESILSPEYAAETKFMKRGTHRSVTRTIQPHPKSKVGQRRSSEVGVNNVVQSRFVGEEPLRR